MNRFSSLRLIIASDSAVANFHVLKHRTFLFLSVLFKAQIHRRGGTEPTPPQATSKVITYPILVSCYIKHRELTDSKQD